LHCPEGENDVRRFRKRSFSKTSISRRGVMKTAIAETVTGERFACRALISAELMEKAW
jgi:hypothetical protein